MKNISLSQRIYLSFLLIVGVILITGLIFYRSANLNQAYVQSIETQDFHGMEIGRNIRMAATDHWLAINHLLIELRLNPAQINMVFAKGRDQLLAKEKLIRTDYQQYARTIANEQDRLLYKELETELNQYFELSKQTLTIAENGNDEQARQALDKQKSAWNLGRETLNEMVRINEASFANNIEVLHQSIVRNIYTVFGGVGVTMLIAVIAGFLLRRAIMTPIAAILTGMKKMGDGVLNYRISQHNQDEFGAMINGFNQMADSLKELVLQTQRSAVQLVTSVTELAATSKQQQATVTETAATTTEIGATSKQITATARQLQQTVAETARTAEQTARLAQTSHSSVHGMDDVMQQLSAAAAMVAGKLALLSERATGINQVVTTIMKVADQTNLLSLNAAIEAEKAGEYGKGFTVVANEIRRLADQTAIATYDIEQMVREIQSAVAAGVMGIDKFSEEVRRGSADMVHVSDQLSLIISKVQELAPHIQLVNEGMSQQAEGADQINIALGQLGEAAGQTVDSLVQTTATLDNMSDVAGKLRTSVNNFQV